MTFAVKKYNESHQEELANPEEGWATPRRINGEQGLPGETGPVGDRGPAGANGVSGIPGVDIEMRYCKGTESTYTGSSDLGTTRNPTGWYTTPPSTDSSYPYIWWIQARINHRRKSDNAEEFEEFLEEPWSSPAKLSGTNGLDGAQGKRGQLIYPAGEFNKDTKYQCTEDKSPYVYDSDAGEFYVLNKPGY